MIATCSTRSAIIRWSRFHCIAPYGSMSAWTRKVDPVYEQLAASTHGGLVRYFNVPGYVDPVDQAAGVGMAASGTLLILIGVWELGLPSVRSAGNTPRSSWADVRPPTVPTDPVIKVPVTSPRPHGSANPDDQRRTGVPPLDSPPSNPPPRTPSSAPRLPRAPASPLARTIEALDNADKAARQTRDKLD